MSIASAILKDLGVSEKRALHDYALLNASQKVAEYTQDCEAFEQKHKMPFHEFENKIKSSDKEVFEEEEEDYLAWKFAVEGSAFWRKKIEQLKDDG
jgi:tellurite resistance protein